MPPILTAEAFRQAARAALLAPGSPLSADVVDRRSSNAGLAVEAAATVGTLLSRQIQEGLEGLWLGTARGEALDLLCRDRYELARNGAAPSRGEVSLSRPTTAHGAISLPAGTQLRAGTVTIELLEGCSFGPVDVGPFVVDAQSTKGGADQGVQASTPLQVLGVADTSIVASVADAFSGEADEESDPELVTRARAFWVNARRGTLGAVVNGALSVPGVYRASALEALDPDGSRAGWIELFIADRAGRANTVLAAAVEEELEEWRCAGVEVVIRTSAPTYVRIRLALDYAAGINTSSKRDEVKRAIMARVNDTPPENGEGSGTLRLSALYAVLDGISGITAAAGAVLEPVGDLVAEEGESIRTRLDLVEVGT